MVSKTTGGGGPKFTLHQGALRFLAENFFAPKAGTLAYLMVLLKSTSSSSSFRDIRRSQIYIRGPCTHLDAPQRNFFAPEACTLPHVSVFLISAPLMCNLRRALSIIGFALKRPPKWGLGSNFGGRGKDIQWEPPRNATTADLRVFRHISSRSDARHVVAFCMVQSFAIGENMGKFWGSTAPLSDLRLSCVTPGLQAGHRKVLFQAFCMFYSHNNCLNAVDTIEDIVSALTVGGHLLSLVRRCLTLCLMIYEILQSAHRPSDSR